MKVLEPTLTIVKYRNSLEWHRRWIELANRFHEINNQHRTFISLLNQNRVHHHQQN